MVANNFNCYCVYAIRLVESLKRVPKSSEIEARGGARHKRQGGTTSVLNQETEV